MPNTPTGRYVSRTLTVQEISDTRVQENRPLILDQIDYGAIEMRILSIMSNNPETLRQYLTKKSLYAAIYGNEILIQQQIDEEGCGAFFGAVKERLYNDH